MGGPGRCADVHLCRVALEQVWREHLFPRLCPSDDGGEGEADSVRVCCPLRVEGGEGDPLQCGFAHAEGEGIER